MYDFPPPDARRAPLDFDSPRRTDTVADALGPHPSASDTLPASDIDSAALAGRGRGSRSRSQVDPKLVARLGGLRVGGEAPWRMNRGWDRERPSPVRSTIVVINQRPQE